MDLPLATCAQRSETRATFGTSGNAGYVSVLAFTWRAIPDGMRRYSCGVAERGSARNRIASWSDGPIILVSHAGRSSCTANAVMFAADGMLCTHSER